MLSSVNNTFSTSIDKELNSSPNLKTAGDEQTIEDTDPPLDEEDLQENNLSVEEADQIVWDDPKTGSAGSEEKDITD